MDRSVFQFTVRVADELRRSEQLTAFAALNTLCRRTFEGLGHEDASAAPEAFVVDPQALDFNWQTVSVRGLVPQKRAAHALRVRIGYQSAGHDILRKDLRPDQGPELDRITSREEYVQLFTDLEHLAGVEVAKDGAEYLGHAESLLAPDLEAGDPLALKGRIEHLALSRGPAGAVGPLRRLQRRSRSFRWSAVARLSTGGTVIASAAGQVAGVEVGGLV